MYEAFKALIKTHRHRLGHLEKGKLHVSLIHEYRCKYTKQHITKKIQ